MSTSLLAFFTLLEKRALSLLPPEKTWRFQRIVDFRAGTAVLQLWEEPDSSTPASLAGQVELREVRHESGAPSFSGSIRNAKASGDARNFSFHPNDEADVERQAELVTEIWRRSLSLGTAQ